MRVIQDIKRYRPYIVHSAKATLKTEVAGSYLSWLWWILEPLCFMMIYTFIALVVFDRSIEYFHLFVFVGLTIWNFFNKNVSASVRILRRSRGMVNKIYFPKYILIIKNMLVNGYKMSISVVLIFAMMIIFKVPFSFYIVYSIPYFFMIAMVTFGMGCILMHLGVFVQDLSNAINIILRLVFYMSGVFYDLPSMVPAPWNELLTKLNPVALAMHGTRNALLYQASPDWSGLFIWLVIGFLLSVFGVHIIYRYENSYGKVL